MSHDFEDGCIASDRDILATALNILCFIKVPLLASMLQFIADALTTVARIILIVLLMGNFNNVFSFV